MREKLVQRLERPEEVYAAAVRAREECSYLAGASAAQILREQLSIRGFVQSASESLEETTARAFGMSVRDLRAYMELLALDAAVRL